ncbi:MAG: hypothetical protein GY928_28365 [Colwellia sp.]|nr:hypothetical protein [Colwellia sp.]
MTLPKKSTIVMSSFDKCAWFKTKKNRAKSRLEFIYNCILYAKSIKSAMTMLSTTNIWSQDMPGEPNRGDKKPKKPASNKQSTRKTSKATKPSYKK